MQLTPADLDLLELIAREYTNRMIAHRLQCSTIAVADALAKLYRKLDATDRASACAAAEKLEVHDANA